MIRPVGTWVAAALFACAIGSVPAVPVRADDAPAERGRTEILDELYEKLAKAESEQVADMLTGSIVRIWRDSGSDTVDLLIDRATDLIEEEDFETALQILDEVVQLAPAYAEGWNKRATVHFKLRNYDASVSDIQHALVIEPRHFGAMSGLAAMLNETGRDQAALEVYRKVLALHPFLDSAQKAIKKLTVEVEGHDI
jgi:tetratricopeptide (TPR) repeat protein